MKITREKYITKGLPTNRKEKCIVNTYFDFPIYVKVIYGFKVFGGTSNTNKIIYNIL